MQGFYHEPARQATLRNRTEYTIKAETSQRGPARRQAAKCLPDQHSIGHKHEIQQKTRTPGGQTWIFGQGFLGPPRA